MFKFDFDLNDNENIEQKLNFRAEPDDEVSQVATPELEPFAEHPLDQLVRAPQNSQKFMFTPDIQPQKFGTDNLAGYSAMRDILLSAVYSAILWSWDCYVDTSRPFRCSIPADFKR